MHACRTDWLNVYADGEASEALVRTIEAHIQSCTSCRLHLAHIKAMKSLVEGIPVMSPPSEIRVRAIESIHTGCAWAQPMLGAYLDGELPLAQQEALDLHLALCQSCRAELAVQRRLQAGVTSLPQVAAPSRIRLQALERCVSRGRIWSLPRLRWPSALANRLATAGTVASAALLLAFFRPALQPSPVPLVETPATGSGAPIVQTQPPATVPGTASVIEQDTPEVTEPVRVEASGPVVQPDNTAVRSHHSRINRNVRPVASRLVATNRTIQEAVRDTADAVANAAPLPVAPVPPVTSRRTVSVPADAVQARLAMKREFEMSQFLDTENMLTQPRETGNVQKDAIRGTDRPVPSPKPAIPANGSAGPVPV